MEHYLNLSTANIAGEVWKDIEGYEGLYQVSNMGRVKGLRREFTFGNRNSKRVLEERIIKPITITAGYLGVCLYKNDSKKSYRLHRLVAKAFIPNENNYSDVNHKDENKTNNTVDNLEWCTCEYNINYGTRNERTTGSSNGFSKKVRCITTGKVFNTIREAGMYYKICDSKGRSHIGDVCSGKSKFCGKLPDGTKLEWEYINE